jgi:hypothetical protein
MPVPTARVTTGGPGAASVTLQEQPINITVTMPVNVPAQPIPGATEGRPGGAFFRRGPGGGQWVNAIGAPVKELAGLDEHASIPKDGPPLAGPLISPQPSQAQVNAAFAKGA